MFFSNWKAIILRSVLILTLLGGLVGVRDVRAAPLGQGNTTTVLVISPAGTALAGKSVYAFNGSTYTGYNKVTDANGEAVLTLPEGNYRFRVDVDGTQFWSGPENHCSNCLSVTITVPEPVLVTVQDTDGTPAAGLNVYAFNGTTYTGFHGTTDQNGQRSLRLQAGSYRFRADLNGTQFWSGTSNHCDVPGCESASVMVSKPMMVTVLDTDGAPKSGLSVYAFNGSTYTGYNKTTGADGQAVFTLPLGSYRFRADLNGTQFWSGTSNHCDIPGCGSASVTVTQPMTVTVLDTNGMPKSDLNVYAFNGSTYTGYSKTTSAGGQAVFTLPLGSYRFRADLNGTQFWSGTSNHCNIPGCASASITVTLPVTVAIRDGGGAPKSGVNVYAFNGSAYTGYSKVSDANGQSVFTLPLGSYRFRADYSGFQYWSGSANHCTVPGCLTASVTVGPAMTATFTPTATEPPTSTYTPVPTDTPTSTPTNTAAYTPTSTRTPSPTPIPTTRVVTTISDSGSGSLRQAILDAISGDTITFAPSLAGQTIRLLSSVAINNKRVILDGSGLSPQVTIDGGDTAGFSLNALSTMDIYDLTISNLNTPLRFRADTTIKNSTLKGFTGDAIYAYASLTILDSTLENNGALAIDAFESTMTIRNSILRNNSQGGIRANGLVSLTITNSTVSGNGGDAIFAGGPSTIVDSTLINNSGRAILSVAPLTIIDTTIYQNSGGALLLNGGTQTTIVNSTIVNQTQGNAPGILVNGGSDVDIFNSTIIANTNRVLYLNSATTFDVYNSILMCTHQNECLFSNGGVINNVNSIVGSNGTLAEFGLAELADNGGPTQTMALLPDSQLIDAGDDAMCLSPQGPGLDQRGVVRPQGAHCDIGAYEYVEENPVPTTTTVIASPNPSQPGQNVTVTATVSSASGMPTGTVDFSVDGAVLCGVPLTSGTATCDLVFAETKTVVATYHPNDNAYSSSSDSVVQTVGPASTTTTVTSTPNPSIEGNSVDIYVTVDNVYGSGTTPTGTVTVTASAGSCTITLSGGQGSCAVVFDEVGTSVIAAAYSGDADHLASSGTTLHEVLVTPTPTATPVLSCNSIRDQVGTIKFLGRTMYLNIPNPNPYAVTISSVFVAWNYAGGHVPGDSRLWLQSADLNGAVFWTGMLNQPNAFLPLSTPVTLPANLTSKITFTFDKTYNRVTGEQIQIQFSTPGCEAYPIIVP